MDEVAHVCNDYWPTARQLWKPAVVVVELGVSHLLWCLKKGANNDCDMVVETRGGGKRKDNPTKEEVRKVKFVKTVSDNIEKTATENVESTGTAKTTEIVDSREKTTDVSTEVTTDVSTEKTTDVSAEKTSEDARESTAEITERSDLGGTRFVDRHFKEGEPRRLEDVKKKLVNMGPHKDRLKMALLAFEAIPKLGIAFREPVVGAGRDCPRMCKSYFKRNGMTGVSLSVINKELGNTTVSLPGNPSRGRNDLIDVHLSNEDLKDVHPAVETNDSVCPSPPRDRLAAYSVGAVKRNGGCIFFAQGHCPFGIDCWFSHLGSERSCIGEASTSRSGYWFSNELGLPGISPPTGNDDEPPGNDDEPPGNNSERAAVIRNIVCELENQSLLPDLVRELFGSAVYRSCCKEGKPRGISCWFQPEVQNLPIFNNQFLSWRSPKRSNSPWEDGVTRVDRRWVQLTVEEKNIVGPIRSKQEEDIVGLV
ncbi:unnamed protein product [Brassica oleracea var. botrytis]